MDGERNRCLYLLKSRGMAHSNQVREFLLTSRGVQLVDVYTGPAGVLTGSARLKQEQQDQKIAAAARQENLRRAGDLERKRLLLQNQIAVLQEEIRGAELEASAVARNSGEELARIASDRDAILRLRDADSTAFPDAPVAKRRNDHGKSDKETAGRGNGHTRGKQVAAPVVRRRRDGKVPHGVR